MRGIFGILGLLVVVAIVGVIAKKQLGATHAPATAAATSSVPGTPAVDTTAAPKQQVEQFKQALDGAMQQARPGGDEGK